MYINLKIMTTLFLIGFIVGFTIIGIFLLLKLFTYREEVSLMKETIQRLEALNARLLYHLYEATVE
jgi:uncharacterized membrane protein YciS (DUF1049 family)